MHAAEMVMDALGSPTRRAIVEILAGGPRAVGQIAADLPVSRPAVSKHLRLLEGAGLVGHVATGRQNVFELRRSGFDAARDWLGSFWVEALHNFAEVAQSTFEDKS